MARETLAKIHGSDTYTTLDGEKEDALQTYLSLWFNTRNWNEEPVVLFSYRPLKEATGLEVDRKYFSFQELMANSALGSVVQQAHADELAEKDLGRDAARR